jgi:hypothetical protein
VARSTEVAGQKAEYETETARKAAEWQAQTDAAQIARARTTPTGGFVPPDSAAMMAMPAGGGTYYDQWRTAAYGG